jgi:hypothetical protein
MTARTTEPFVPAVTRFSDDPSAETGRPVAHLRALLTSGAHGRALFRTAPGADAITLSGGMAARVAPGLERRPRIARREDVVAAQQCDTAFARERPPFVPAAPGHAEPVVAAVCLAGPRW